MLVRTALLLAALTLSACAPKSYVVLLEDEDGSTGALNVETGGGAQRVETAGTAVALEADRPRSPWQATVDSIREVFASAFAQRPPAHSTYVLYFEFGNAELTESSAETLAALRADIAERPAPVVVLQERDQIRALVHAPASGIRPRPFHGVVSSCSRNAETARK